MPNYYNPYNFYPATYQTMYPMNQGYSQQMPMQQSGAQPAPMKSMEWVEGEVGAKAFQMPQGWPANQPIPLWDSTDTYIYLKSWSPMGIPNPMQKLKYEMPEQQNQMFLQSGSTNGTSSQIDTSQFVTKNEFDQMKNKLNELMQNQNGNKNGPQR